MHEKQPLIRKISPKIIPFRLILHEFDTLFTLRTYSAQLWKKYPFTWIFGRAWYLLDIWVAPRDSHTNLLYFGRNFDQNHLFSKISLNLSQFWLKFGKILKNQPIHIPNFAFHKRTFIYMYQEADFATHVGGWLLYRVLTQLKTWDLVSTSLPSVFISFKLKW